jgi:hypothetical protein
MRRWLRTVSARTPFSVFLWLRPEMEKARRAEAFWVVNVEALMRVLNAGTDATPA